MHAILMRVTDSLNPCLLADTLNYIFTGVYIAEFLLKLYGLGPRKYFSSYFNIGDFAVRTELILAGWP